VRRRHPLSRAEAGGKTEAWLGRRHADNHNAGRRAIKPDANARELSGTGKKDFAGIREHAVSDFGNS